MIERFIKSGIIGDFGKGKAVVVLGPRQVGKTTLLPRCFAFVGPYLRRDIHFAIGNFIQNCLDGQPIIIKGDGTPLRSYMYADDLVEWLFAILERGESGRPYNVGSPEALSIRELAERVSSILGEDGQKVPVVVQGIPTGAPPSVYVPKTARAERELGLLIGVDFLSAVLRSI